MTEPRRTIHEWANEIRQSGIEKYGEKVFSLLVMHFNNLIPVGDDRDKLREVMQILADSDNASLMQYAVIWLDGAGYGDVSTTTLFREINAVRSAHHQDIQGDEWDYF